MSPSAAAGTRIRAATREAQHHERALLDEREDPARCDCQGLGEHDQCHGQRRDYPERVDDLIPSPDPSWLP